MSRDAHIVGIGISEEQLGKNKIFKEAICADVQTHDFPEASFDMIVCSNVLEYLKYPEEALQRFYTALKENGILLINSPNFISTKGIFIKITPYRFYIWFYRVTRDWKEAGRDCNPFQAICGSRSDQKRSGDLALPEISPSYTKASLDMETR